MEMNIQGVIARDADSMAWTSPGACLWSSGMMAFYDGTDEDEDDDAKINSIFPYMCICHFIACLISISSSSSSSSPLPPLRFLEIMSKAGVSPQAYRLSRRTPSRQS